MRPDY
jgi:hypothetical protein